MDLEEKATKKELIETIERRFQFAMLVLLFMPGSLQNMFEILNSFITKVDHQIVLGSIITLVLFSYLLIEIIKNSLKRRELEMVKGVVLLVSYLAIITVGIASIYKSAQIVGWKLFTLEISITLNLLTTFVLLLACLWFFLRYGFRSPVKRNN